MKKVIALLFALALVFAGSAYAADYGKKTMKSGADVSAQADHIVKADDLTGKTLKDRAGTDIGNIKSVVFDTSTGAAFAMVSLDDKLHPVPINAIKKSGDNFTVNIDRDKLAKSPALTEDDMKQQLAGRDFDSQVYRLYGITPPWGGGKQMKHKKSVQ